MDVGTRLTYTQSHQNHLKIIDNLAEQAVAWHEIHEFAEVKEMALEI